MLACSVALLALAAPAGRAEVVLDGSVGTQGKLTLNGQDVRITPEMGTTRGGNLFHSFETFGVPQGDAVTFEGPQGLTNVIGRVTGPDVSQIHGTLRSTVPAASLWLLNPNGLVVGKTARIDVPGALHLSTADELRFEDGSTYSARDLPGSTLTAADPSAFGFLGGPIGELSLDASAIELQPFAALSLTGGAVTLSGTQIGVPAGPVLVAAQAGAGEVPLASDGATPRDGDLTLRNGATLVALLPFAGMTIRMEAGRFVLDQAQILAASLLDQDDAAAQAIGLDLAARSVTLQGDGSGAAQIGARALGPGKAPYIRLDAADLTVDGAGLLSAPFSGGGRAGDVTIVAERILLTNDALVGTPALFASGAGAGGTTRVTASEGLTLSEGAAINSVTASDFDAGDVVLDVGTLVLADASVASASLAGSGAAGAVTIRASGGVSLSGQSSILSIALAGARGGDIQLGAEALTLAPGTLVVASSAGAGDAGSIRIDAGTLALQEDARIGADAGGTGDAGAIRIRVAGELRADGGLISTASTQSSGGTIAIEAGQRVILENQAGILTTILGGSAGEQAGAVAIFGPDGRQAGTLTLDSSARIVANAPNVGDGGTIRIRTDGLIARPGQIDASARQGNSGTVASAAPQTDITSSLAGLDAQVAPADRLLASSCDAREIASSLIVGAVQRGPAAFDPDRPLGSDHTGSDCPR